MQGLKVFACRNTRLAEACVSTIASFLRLPFLRLPNMRNHDAWNRRRLSFTLPHCQLQGFVAHYSSPAVEIWAPPIVYIDALAIKLGASVPTSVLDMLNPSLWLLFVSTRARRGQARLVAARLFSSHSDIYMCQLFLCNHTVVAIPSCACVFLPVLN